MSLMVLAMLASSAAAEPAAPPTSCLLRTPSNEVVELSALPSKAYIVRQVAIGGNFFLATVFRLDRGEPKLPVAVGFCRRATSSSDADADRSARVSAPPSVSLVDPTRWADSECTLISRDGRAARIDYEPYDGGRATFIGSTGWPWKGKITVDRGQESVNKARVRITKLGGRRGLSATEHFYIAGTNAANIILFDKLGPKTSQDDPAAAICGYANITRAPSNQ